MTRRLFLSPHLDDAALSCGGLLAKLKSQRAAVEIINIFAGIPDSKLPLSSFAQYQHHQWGGASQAYHIRRAEDETALAYFDLKPVHLDFPDCIYRGEADQDDWYYISDDDIFGSIHPAEAGFPAQIARAIENEINHLNSSKPQETLLYAPLAVGHHVDHQLVFLAAAQLARRGYPLYLYEDYPYAQRNPGDTSRAVQSCAQSLSSPLKPALRFLSESDLSVKIKAIAAYASQLQVLFRGEEAMVRKVRAFAVQVGKTKLAERLWTAGTR